ncbi:DUF6913 domain-containing protein [Flavobacterium sp. C4GT6]|uniref:DUF6913 domain-containing protein n=1 Tax=Flavobacterium sp. C4GT6 TaxID=3103818 RepID=UPI003FA60230
MFLKFIKGLGLKKNIKKCLAQYKPTGMPQRVFKVGLLMDEALFTGKKNALSEITKYGIKEENISLLVYSKGVSPKNEAQMEYRAYSRKFVSAGGNFVKEPVASFVSAPFDLLISYYNADNPLLMLATLESQAKFKVGLASADSRLNDFTIAVEPAKYKEYMAELFKYLKILNII